MAVSPLGEENHCIYFDLILLVSDALFEFNIGRWLDHSLISWFPLADIFSAALYVKIKKYLTPKCMIHLHMVVLHRYSYTVAVTRF